MTQQNILADELAQRLTNDITWRIVEVSAYKRASELSDEVKASALRRAGVPLLYAHLEGFFSVATNLYVGFIARQNISLSTLRPNFWALCVMHRRKASMINSETQFFRFLLELDGLVGNSFRKGRYERISAKSNLSSEVLLFGCEMLGLDTEKFVAYSEFLDQHLLPTRNFIAHGESHSITLHKFDLFRDQVVDLMRALKNEIENAAYTQAYIQN